MGEDRGRIAPGGGRLAGGQAHFPAGHGEPGDGIHHEDHVGALIPEKFGHGRGRIGRAQADERTLVRGGDHEHGPGKPFRAEILFDEFTQLAAALANEPDDVDVGLGVAGDHAHERRFSDARSGHDADALALAEGEQAVYGPHAHIHGVADARTFHGRRRRRENRHQGRGGQGRATVDGIAEGVDDPAEKVVADREKRRRARVADERAGRDAAQIAVGHEKAGPVPEPHHLGRHLGGRAPAVVGEEFAHRTDRRLDAPALGHQPDHLGHLAVGPGRAHLLQHGQGRLGIKQHRNRPPPVGRTGFPRTRTGWPRCCPPGRRGFPGRRCPAARPGWPAPGTG